MDLTSDDVQDILHLLDGLPFGELHLETARFRLWLRRAPDGGWTQETQLLAPPKTLPDPAGTTVPGLADHRRTGSGPPSNPAQPAPAQPNPAQPNQAQPNQAQPAPAASVADSGLDDGLADVCAPLLGTFYRAPRPGAPPFVDIGSVVDEHTVIGIIETMKLMNSVAADVSGTVAQILVGNAQFAEQGTVLMRIRQDR